eukprot:7364851-Pyramimonas_sp.AAC.1
MFYMCCLHLRLPSNTTSLRDAARWEDSPRGCGARPPVHHCSDVCYSLRVPVQSWRRDCGQSSN